MDKLSSDLFLSNIGSNIYSSFVNVIDKYAMRDKLASGVLVGLSGGADSVMLLLLLLEFKRREALDFKILAVHVNHMIRGDEADRDEEFSRTLASSCGVEFIGVGVDVPRLSKEMGVGMEEAARHARYLEFSKIISGRDDIHAIATAHNATDNAETVLFNIARGSGARGAAGIAPVRDNIIRPMITVEKKDVVLALDSVSLKYVTDSTNYSTEYSRNYIRHEIIPRLERINSASVASISSFSASVREDVEFIESEAVDFLRKYDDAAVPRTDLAQLHPALLARVIMLMSKKCGIRSLERSHLVGISGLLVGDNFKYSVPGGYEFVCERGVCAFRCCDYSERRELRQELTGGENKIVGYNCVFTVGELVFSRNVYKFSIHADLSSAIINGSLYVRFREDGDSYRYGGITHKLKKVFNDKDIPPSVRDRIPIVCDADGIVWVPGLGVRDDGVRGGRVPIAFSVLSDSSDMPVYAIGMPKSSIRKGMEVLNEV